MRTIGRSRALLAVLSGCLLLAACGHGPSQVGAAVIVGDSSVSVDDVQAKLNKLLGDNDFARQLASQHKLDLLSRGIVSQEVLHVLAGHAAAEEGIQVDEAAVAARIPALQAQEQAPVGTDDITAALRQAAASAFDPAEVARDQEIEVQLAKRYLNRLSVTVDLGQVSQGDVKTTAGQLADQVAADPAKAETLLGTLTDDQGQPAGRNDLKVDLFSLVSQGGIQVAAGSPLFTVPPGTVIAFPEDSPSPDGSVSSVWFVVLVKQRDTNAAVPVPPGFNPASIEDSTLQQVGERLLQPYLADSGVKINPRYGVWDPTANTLAASEGEFAGVVKPVAAAQPKP